MYQNYIFDLYGTLVDIHTNEEKRSLWSNLSHYMTLQGAAYKASELKKEYHRLIRKEKERNYAAVPTVYGETLAVFDEMEVDFTAVISTLFKNKGAAADEAMIRHWALVFRTLSLCRLRLFPGAKELLIGLKKQGRNVYLLSNAQRLFTEPEMRALGIYDLFDDVLYSSDIGFTKPSSLFYQALLTRHHLDPEQSVMTGNDFLADAWGAHNNGMASIYIHTEQSPEITGKLPPDCIQIQQIYDVMQV